MYHNPLFCRTYDNAIRWHARERLDHLFEQRCDRLAHERGKDHPAVIAGDVTASYDELDRRANRLARHLCARGVKADDRVGIMLRQSVDTYVALLAVLKINAAYVPLDPSFPPDRLRFIAGDAGIEKIVTVEENRARLDGVPVEPIFLDLAAERIAAEHDARLTEAEKGEPREQLCYIVYTSGSTGYPKGVAIEHPSICNFVRVAAEVYGYGEEDRVYQGMTIAFDFSVEEIWVPLMAGATLVPGMSDATLVGRDLADFLAANRVTALCCVPTLLATIDRDLPDLRLLLVSGEACPHDLVVRWHRPGRTILNAYGPTEATVTATWTELHPEKPVTIGVPMPTYSVVILDEHENKVVPEGASGEICIAGVGLAKGYVNRNDLTEKAFIPDFIGIANNPSGRIYRTGDLGRIIAEGEIEYQGRIDTQVKIRGYRIELTEIESVLMEAPEVAQAVVSTYAVEGGPKELVAYCTLKEGIEELPREAIAALLRGRLPGYMIPAYVEEVAHIPMLPSHKADRKALPPPAGPRFTAGSTSYVAPADELEETIAAALAEILEVDRVSVEDNFFADLGAHSLLMARYASVIRERVPGADVSMRDIYLKPTVTKLAAFIREQAFAQTPKSTAVPFRKPSNLQYYGCGLLQLLFYAGGAWAGLNVMVVGLEWILASTSVIDVYLRIVGFGVGAFLVLSLLPILAKWLLVGRWKVQRFPIWGLRYFRFWVVKTLIQVNPILLFRDTPLINLYLRLLGMKIGSNAFFQGRVLPICTDLISIGSDTVLRNHSAMLGYRAEAGYIVTGHISIGRNAIVGEASFIDIGTVMEDDTQLGHSSTLHTGTTIPAGKRYHGSPAQECGTDYDRMERGAITNRRRVVYSAVRVFTSFFGTIPFLPIGVFLIFPSLFGRDLKSAAGLLPEISPMIVLLIVALSAFFFLGRLISSLTRVAGMPRLFNLLLREDHEYVLYGLHYYLYTRLNSVSNSELFNTLFGDSSFIVNYLQLVGVNLPNVVQTGSNFGTAQVHDTPFLCTVGPGTMVSSRLAMMNARFSNSSFKLLKLTIGENNFLGNLIYYPAGARVGDNCLLATKAMLPIDGPMRTDTGLLGSPPFEIPRSARKDRNIAVVSDERIRRELLARKDKFNIASMAAYLLMQWMLVLFSMVFAYCGLVLYGHFGLMALAAVSVVFAAFAIGYLIAFEWWSLRFRKLQPHACTILDPYYWHIERHWKMSDTILTFLFKGTPYKNLISRLLGTPTGKKVFDDGYLATERTLTEIGDYCTLNEFSILQNHSLEDGVFKSDTVKLGTGCTVGPNAFVHYGVVMGDNSVVDTDAFLMKGETPPAGSVWQGNPARQI